MRFHFVKKLLYKFQHRSLVLMYHNIAAPESDPWELCVSPENFRQHLEVLKKFQPRAVGQFAKEFKSGTIALTFDDGYTDNFLAARPLLHEFETPAMFFISTGYIGGKEMYWWDELGQLLLNNLPLPSTLQLDFGEFTFGEDALLSEAKFEKQQQWFWHQPPPSKRCEHYLEIWKNLRPLPHNHIRRYIDQIAAWAGRAILPSDKRAMTRSQLAQLVNDPFVQTGVHTVTHPALADHAKDFQLAELKNSRDELLEMQLDASYAAYPYGSFDGHTIEACKQLKLSGAFTTREAVITNKTDPFQIPRFQVRNVNGDEFEKQLRKWMKEFPS